MREHRALLKAMDRVNKNAQITFTKSLIKSGMDPNNFQLKFSGSYKNKVKVEYDGFDDFNLFDGCEGEEK